MNIERALGALEIACGAEEVARQDLAAARELDALGEVLFEEGMISDKERAASRL